MYTLILDKTDFSFKIHDGEHSGRWFILEETTRLDYDTLIKSEYQIESIRSFKYIWSDSIDSGYVTLHEFDNFEEVVEYLEDIKFIEELKK